MVSEPMAAGRPSGGVALPHPRSHAIPEAPPAALAVYGESTSHLPAWVTNDRKVHLSQLQQQFTHISNISAYAHILLQLLHHISALTVPPRKTLRTIIKS